MKEFIHCYWRYESYWKQTLRPKKEDASRTTNMREWWWWWWWQWLFCVCLPWQEHTLPQWIFSTSKWWLSIRRRRKHPNLTDQIKIVPWSSQRLAQPHWNNMRCSHRQTLIHIWIIFRSDFSFWSHSVENGCACSIWNELNLYDTWQTETWLFLSQKWATYNTHRQIPLLSHFVYVSLLQWQKLQSIVTSTYKRNSHLYRKLHITQVHTKYVYIKSASRMEKCE